MVTGRRQLCRGSEGSPGQGLRRSKTPPPTWRAWMPAGRSASCPIWPGAGRCGPRPSASRASAPSTCKDVAIASGAGYRIKLLGRALALPDGRQAAYVAPHLVPQSCPVAGVDDVFNAIMIRGNAVGDVMFYGRGAGDLPTASAVMGDVHGRPPAPGEAPEAGLGQGRDAGGLRHGAASVLVPAGRLHAAPGQRDPGRRRRDRGPGVPPGGQGAGPARLGAQVMLPVLR